MVSGWVVRVSFKSELQLPILAINLTLGHASLFRCFSLWSSPAPYAGGRKKNNALEIKTVTRSMVYVLRLLFSSSALLPGA